MAEPQGEMRFGFGKNWSEFVDERLSEEIIVESQEHMSDLLRTDSLAGKTFLDIGCGSGIHSLAAIRLGAEKVISFDYDQDSVDTTKRVREFAGGAENWEVVQGSVLDEDYMHTFAKADIVYSWGVLHHTGDMWTAVRNAGIPLKKDGIFYIALYSSDNYVDPTPEYWLKTKKAYNLAGPIGKRLSEWKYAMRFHIIPELKNGRNPLKLMRDYGLRGMTYWTDVKDWLGGWPMDFASLEETRDFCADNFDLDLVNLKTGEGCTEYVFANTKENEHWREIEATRTTIPLEGQFHPQGGYGYAAELPPELEASAADNENPRRSRLMLYEDGKILGLAHSVHDHIVRYGKGRFCHWGKNLYFSASDGSDPNTNGRTYAYCIRF